ncbi:hypothetical protein [Bosea sp. (in: a-proteobacteria)]|uniref:hypothetical protein n=1 Tax=Bosea sp. (in: a-proteobacteria) TaxID=1871050 RepID=UPI00261513D1|nr:hypothetical protein [Bosea sp. (in: a-proteobacteria)]MCO5090049.1 hypothetical protein [Bosea sp. (in: a-proteobacteria)]
MHDPRVSRRCSAGRLIEINTNADARLDSRSRRVVSRKTLDELDRTPDEDVRSRLRDYALGLAELLGEESGHASRLGQRLVEVPFMAALPDENDRELIGNAVGYECDAFCTCDRRTIVSKRDTLTRILPIRIMTPVEWWASIKPWGRLWL